MPASSDHVIDHIRIGKAFAACEFFCYSPVFHNYESVAHTYEFGQFFGNDQYRLALLLHIRHEAVHIALNTDIHPAGGTVQD